jgi:hypothetical protein
MTEDEFIKECERIVYEEDWSKEMFADLKDGREFFLGYFRKGYTPQRMMDELESEEY